MKLTVISYLFLYHIEATFAITFKCEIFLGSGSTYLADLVLCTSPDDNKIFLKKAAKFESEYGNKFHPELVPNNDEHCFLNFRLHKNYLVKIRKYLNIDNVINCQESKVSETEALCILLLRIAYPNRCVFIESQDEKIETFFALDNGKNVENVLATKIINDELKGSSGLTFFAEIQQKECTIFHTFKVKKAIFFFPNKNELLKKITGCDWYIMINQKTENVLFSPTENKIRMEERMISIISKHQNKTPSYKKVGALIGMYRTFSFPWIEGKILLNAESKINFTDQMTKWAEVAALKMTQGVPIPVAKDVSAHDARYEKISEDPLKPIEYHLMIESSNGCYYRLIPTEKNFDPNFKLWEISFKEVELIQL